MRPLRDDEGRPPGANRERSLRLLRAIDQAADDGSGSWELSEFERIVFHGSPGCRAGSNRRQGTATRAREPDTGFGWASCRRGPERAPTA